MEKGQMMTTTECRHERRGYMGVNRGSTVTTLNVGCLDCGKTYRVSGDGTGATYERQLMDSVDFRLAAAIRDFGSNRPFTLHVPTGHVTWDDGIQASAWIDADGEFRVAQV